MNNKGSGFILIFLLISAIGISTISIREFKRKNENKEYLIQNSTNNELNQKIKNKIDNHIVNLNLDTLTEKHLLIVLSKWCPANKKFIIFENLTYDIID